MNVSALFAEVVTKYADIGIDLAIDVVAILLMAYVLYFRRHWRADLLLSYVTLNLGIFVVMSVLSVVKVDIAVGFGLFAILSIIRLRSSAVTQQEVAYYFVALVMGLVNGMNVADRGLVVGLNVLLLVVMAVFDSKTLRDRSRRVDVQLKKVYDNDAALVADLERALGGRVMYHEITELDLGRGHTTVDVRYRPGVGVVRHEVVEESAPVESVGPRHAGPAAEEIPAGSAEQTEILVYAGARDSDENRSARTN
ncbi:MAG: hypothetical protein QOK35_3253 [Pseudonocardiales bacterium]|jgi:hypothetical protein|nr:hypothetical protein [Pseudonocardiales bacterium]